MRKKFSCLNPAGEFACYLCCFPKRSCGSKSSWLSQNPQNIFYFVPLLIKMIVQIAMTTAMIINETIIFSPRLLNLVLSKRASRREALLTCLDYLSSLMFFSSSTIFSGRMVGNSRTSRIDGASVSSMTKRSIPMPRPPVGGMPYSIARR